MDNKINGDKIKELIKKHKLYDCKNLDKFIKSIKTTLPYRGYSGSQFFINEIDNINFITKLNFYRKDAPELYGVTTPGTMSQNRAEIRILDILKKEILEKKISPCIIEQIYVHDCKSFNEIETSEKKCDEYRHSISNDLHEIIHGLFCKQFDLIKEGLSNDGFTFVALERSDITLRTYLNNYFPENIIAMSILKSLLFQIIFTIYKIKKKYPSFAHNDLHTDNIMLKYDYDFNFNPMNIKYIIYKDSLTHWAIPYFGIIPKIIDFGFSIISELGVVSNVVDNKTMMYYRPDNDILFLLYDIYDVTLDPNVVKLFTKLDPTDFFINYDIKYTRDHPEKVPTYKQMLYNDVWKEYKNLEVTPSQKIYEFGE